MSLNGEIKKLFFTTAKLNISLHLSFIPTSENEADAPTRRLTTLDCKLHPDIWAKVQEQFGGHRGHTCDLMALDSNVMAFLCHILLHIHHLNLGVSMFLRKIYQMGLLFWTILTFSPLSPWWVPFYVS